MIKMSLFILLFHLLFICNHITNAHCPDDQDLQDHHCVCSPANHFVLCSSLPNQCRTCSRYKGILFDEKVNILPVDAFRFYDFFGSDDKNVLFKIQFAHINTLSSNSFSKINITRYRTLEIKIVKYSYSALPTRLFEDVEIQSKSKLNIEVFNVTSPILMIKQNAFDGIKFQRESRFQLSIYHAKDTILFESNAGSLLLPSYSSMELYFLNFLQVFLNPHSFAHVRQEHSSELIIKFDRFQYASLAQNSFVNFHQLRESRFHLSLLNFHGLTIEQNLFERVTQLKSYIIISIYNLTNDLCLPNKTFDQIKQDFNSTFQFEINYGQNLLFTSNSITNVNQNLQSKFTIAIANSLDIYFSRCAFNNIHQEDHSLIDISVKYGQNLIFDDYAINNMNINHSSMLKIGYQHSIGTLQMTMNSFSNINEGQGGELVFQIMNSSDFYFRFNQSTSLQRLVILDPPLSSNDFCRIANIPAHISVKLLHTYQCSCTVYYLYRNLYRKIHPTDLRNLVPICYINMSLDDIENECSFSKQIYDCQQSATEIQINIPRGICENNSRSNKNQFKKRWTFLSVVSILIIFSSMILTATCIYILFSKNRREPLLNFISMCYYRYRRQKLPIFSADPYEELPTNDQEESNDSRRSIIVTYNTTTEQTELCLDSDKIEFIVSETDHHRQTTLDAKIKLNTNPMNETEDYNTLKMISFS
ncbi:unnamed protein product [Rotaria socialis]|uniref:Uncharacterized protein n=2 Tax=Rotaria socialis TaxID=392032 RepID=A0A821LJ39_9BILA|nr:unnamed protein product [Rotaria socialis]